MAKKKPRKSKAEKEQPKKAKQPKVKAALVNSIDVQVKLLKRFKNMAKEGNFYQHHEVEKYIRALQKGIIETPIRKSDKYGNEIETVQRIVLNAYNNRKAGQISFHIPPALRDQLYTISKSERVRPSIALIKRIVGCVGVSYNKAAKRLKAIRKALDKAYEKSTIRESDPYYNMVRVAERALDKALTDRVPVVMASATLSGLNGILRRETGENF